MVVTCKVNSMYGAGDWQFIFVDSSNEFLKESCFMSVSCFSLE